jgi:cytochrome oxidase assembly protein ShyY1
MMTKNSVLRLLASGLVMLLLTGIFYELGIWQWHRAQAVARAAKIVPSAVPVTLTSIDVAGKNMRTSSINRIVTFEGRYVKSYSAPTQNVPGIGYKDLLVGLFEISGNRAILVVRGLNDSSLKPTTEKISIAGRLYPSQREDHGLNSDSTLGRLDPALIAGTGGYSLFDGYVIAQSETNSQGVVIVGNRIPTPVLTQSVSIFYWQHISYVVIWWFMGLLVLAAPVIAKRNTKDQEIVDKVEL